jgi:hypothetical protein
MHAYLLTGQALRLSVMLGLHLLDESYDEGLLRPVRHVFPSLLHEPTCYDELEGIHPLIPRLDISERRRTFWMVHICAQMTSVQTLWPACALTTSEIYTCRPANDDGFGQIVSPLICSRIYWDDSSPNSFPNSIQFAPFAPIMHANRSVPATLFPLRRVQVGSVA